MESKTEGFNEANPGSLPVEVSTTDGFDEANPANIPVEVLRKFVNEQVERSSLMHVAARAGMSRTSLATFLEGAKPHRRNHRTLGIYYLGAKDAAPREQALEVLADGDGRLKKALLRSIEAYSRKRGWPTPPWVEILLRGKR